ncbi:MAG TPA: hypothetical protein VFJ58_30120 [Armatimonadota bacterium]|nr:hypothetical protein [Armatimonadota bacterium]
MEAAIREFRPDVLVTLADIWTLNWMTVLPSGTCAGSAITLSTRGR